MAMILIVEDDRVLAEAVVHLLRKAGHSPVLAADARTALREALDLPDLILLDLVLPDLPGEEILHHLQSQLETAGIPVLVLTGYPEAAARLKKPGTGGVVGVYLKPISGTQLRQAVDAALAGTAGQDAHDDAQRQRQRELIERLIREGPDALSFHVYRRLNADRVKARGSPSAEVLTWTEIAEWARHERLLDAEQARLLRRWRLGGPPGGGEEAA
jgi:DNA-binding response OmpR family regulator